jgi:hypothetical protein
LPAEDKNPVGFPQGIYKWVQALRYDNPRLGNLTY